MNLLSAIKSYALDLGFDACGAAPCRPMPEATAAVSRWTSDGLHGGMEYMERNRELREDPSKLYEGARSVIVCLISYKTEERYPKGIPQIAAYARFPDYHYTVKEKLNRLLDRVREIGPGCRGRAFVDSAPIHEKNWAVEAGLGWVGRNSLLIHPGLGSFCFIGIILTDLELDHYDTPYTGNHCGNCRKCIDACPANAIREDGRIDANRCLSCQTIENRGPIPPDIVPSLGERLFGCDTCQDVCPWNTKPAPVNHPVFTPVDGIFGITAGEWQAMGSGAFKRRFGHTPLARAGLKKLRLTLSQKEEK